jgi:myo-inositol 2-dehydrogenase/D-chiro-inositol 1-dehydrogenase
MLKIVIVGAGSHSQGNHLPSLARYVREYPGQIRLTGLCDLRRGHAVKMAAQYGFAQAYVDLDEMLREVQPNGCVAVTPIPVTCEIAERIIRAGVPLLMEKPPGATVAEARQIVNLVHQTGAHVMVSMNRRFDPALRMALEWWGERPLHYVRGTIVRVDRREPEFFYGTAIHPLDALREISGDVSDVSLDERRDDEVRWYTVRLAFERGAAGVLEVLPTAGSMAEAYELYGPGCRALVRVGGPDTGEVRCWKGGELVLEENPTHGEPTFVRNGTYAETSAFIQSLDGGQPVHPTPAEVLQTVELCEKIQQGT